MVQPSEGLPLQNKRSAGQKNVAHTALVDESKIYVPPLYITLGLIKIFVKAMDEDSEGFAYLRQKFPKIHESKMKEGILLVHELFEPHDFTKKLEATERRAWEAFGSICRNLLGNEKAENYSEIVQEPILSDCCGV
jgi:hypothetical protein